MITYVFPGQGAQKKGMGGCLFDEFHELTKQADEVLSYSIRELCLNDPQGNLNQTQFTQPALYTVNALSYLKTIIDTGQKPDFVAGHSLGEYNALFASGAFDFRTGLELVKKRGELMSRATGGGMAAIIGLTEEKIRETLLMNRLDGIDVANLNAPVQIVISGTKADIELAQTVFEKTNGVEMFVPLRTSGAFHSRYMQEAKQEFKEFLAQYHFLDLKIPVISNVQARPYTASAIQENMVEQITQPVKWTESIRYLMGKGHMKFEEIGVGKVLTGLITRIQAEAEPLIVNEEERLLIPKERESVVQAGGTVKEESTKANSSVAVLEYEAQAPTEKQVHMAAVLGDTAFKRDYNLTYAYMSGAMYRGIASKEMVIRMGKAGMLGVFGTGGLSIADVEAAVTDIQKELSQGQAYGFNFLYSPSDSRKEEQLAELFIARGVKVIEASAYLSITPALVRYRAKGLRQDERGVLSATHKIIAKVSRPEIAEVFLSPAPERIVAKLLAEQLITSQEAQWLSKVPMADDLTVEADSGGHTDGGVAYALMPAMRKLRDEMMVKYRYPKRIRVGAAGGIGTPEAAAAAFIMGADYIVTGSVNQCTVEAATSDTVKDMLQQINVQDTEYAPAGDMFELGAKIQVLRRGVFFPSRANKLYDLYRMHASLDDIDEKTKLQIQDKYFKRSFEQVLAEIKPYYSPQDWEQALNNPKQKMAMLFKWYFTYSSRLALQGSEESKVDYQVHCGPALGALNQELKGTALESWRNRHVDELALFLLDGAAQRLKEQLNTILRIDELRTDM
ncbi:ACP S-malonyltransferase [Paenibacillus albidus]|uniref:ACP S-malonyltransferase n=1 Tax=Paenibacillus albidus TaxID=2041023 RepID=UPI001BEBF550|nr:ACP S-malonyltransferase [Paenibacillus albidus]MBT2288310.1 ACP S-malonyltransferase [Paenibacillus albidus]